ncbi:MAG: WYL domain-containing protein [Fibrobacteria bacterium]|nr:WYL domain-containing protein [Fibrobacteria bacterium]
MSNLEPITKINTILNSLVQGETISKKDLSERTGIHHRTIERHIDFLRDALRAPLVCLPGASAYRYDLDAGDRFELPGIWFSKDELAALFAIKQVLGDIPEGALSKVADKLWERIEKVSVESGQLPDSDWTGKVKILPIGGRTIEDGVFRALVEGVLLGKRLRIVHKKLGADSRERTVSPLQIVRFRDNWYLDAWCHVEDGFRSFAMNRISKVLVLQDPSLRKDSAELSMHFASAYGIFNGKADKIARIKFFGIAAEEVSQERWHSMEEGHFLDDGSYQLSIPFHKDIELVMDVLRWGELAVVLEPEELREKVRKKLEAALGRY